MKIHYESLITVNQFMFIGVFGIHNSFSCAYFSFENFNFRKYLMETGSLFQKHAKSK